MRIGDLSDAGTDPLARTVRKALRKRFQVKHGVPMLLSVEPPRCQLQDVPGNPKDYQVHAVSDLCKLLMSYYSLKLTMLADHPQLQSQNHPRLGPDAGHFWQRCCQLHPVRACGQALQARPALQDPGKPPCQRCTQQQPLQWLSAVVCRPSSIAPCWSACAPEKRRLTATHEGLRWTSTT